MHCFTLCFDKSSPCEGDPSKIFVVCCTSNHPLPRLTCVPGVVACGPGQRVSETIEEVEEGPGQDDDIESGIKLDHYGRIAGTWRERTSNTRVTNQNHPLVVTFTRSSFVSNCVAGSDKVVSSSVSYSAMSPVQGNGTVG